MTSNLFYDNISPHRPSGLMKVKKVSGRRRLLTSLDCLGLCLSWTRTRGGMFVLSMIFGMTSSSVSEYVRFGRRILIQVLKGRTDAMVRIPSNEQIENYKNVIKSMFPSLKNVWMAMDGLKLYLEQSSCCVIQNRFYNGWTHDHYVTNILGFCPAGTIVVACTNVPGCIHDSTVCDWGNIYQKLEEVYLRNGGKCAVDSAFCKKKNDFLIKSSQSLPDTAEEIVVNREATSMRQSAEWGMRTFQSSFPRIKDRIIYEEGSE